MTEVIVLEPGLVALNESAVKHYEELKKREAMLKSYLEKLKTNKVKQ